MSNPIFAIDASLSDGLINEADSGFVDNYQDEKGDFEPAPRASHTRRPTSPGAILRDLYLPRAGVNLTELAAQLNVSRRSVSQIVNESRPVTVDMANRLARAFGTSPQFWLTLQNHLDVWKAMHVYREEYERIQPLARVTTR